MTDFRNNASSVTEETLNAGKSKAVNNRFAQENKAFTNSLSM